jgi:predicted nucleic acid-binding protein
LAQFALRKKTCWCLQIDMLIPNGLPIGEMDTSIAAHALAENLILLTHNTRHFERVPGLRVQDWIA